MPNYTMQFGVSQVASILKIESDLVKTLAYKFSDYLSTKANPIKGHPRKFLIEDVRVLAYILTNWEDDPDVENIKHGLNSNSHYDNLPIDNLITGIIPLFRDTPEDIDENWKGVILFMGMAEIADRFELAKSYKLSGDRLVEIALINDEDFELICPVVYNYRHAVELYLKDALDYQKKSHNLLLLFTEFKTLLKKELDIIPPTRYENIILAFNDFDPDGTTFRYGTVSQTDEIFIDLRHMKTLMEWLAESFQNFRNYKYR